MLALLVTVVVQIHLTSNLGPPQHQQQQQQLARVAVQRPPQQQLHLIQAVNHVQEFGKLLRFPTNAVPVSKPETTTQNIFISYIRFPFS